MHAIVQVPRAVSRLIHMPREDKSDQSWNYIYLASLIKQHVADLFPGLIIDGVHAFRVTRNSDLYVDEEEADNLLRSIEQELRRSSRVTLFAWRWKLIALATSRICSSNFST